MRNRKVKLRSIWGIVHRRAPGGWLIFISGRFRAKEIRTEHFFSTIAYPDCKTRDAKEVPAVTWSKDGELWVK